MQSFLDNTGLQSSALVLAGMARGPEDVQEFLQLLILIVFSDSLVVGGFELAEVAEKTAAATEVIGSSLPGPVIRISTIPEWDFTSACLRAAEQCAEDFSVAFSPGKSPSIQTYPVAVKPETLLTRAALLNRLLRSQLSKGDILGISAEAIQQKKAGAVAVMVAGSETLRECILRSIAGSGELTVGYLNELEAFCRVYLNDELARRESSLYAPAVARARRLRQSKVQLIASLSNVIDDVVSEMRILPLVMPAMAAILARRGNSDPTRMLQEAAVLREQLSTVRRWLQAVVGADGYPSEKARDEHVLQEITDVLRSSLGSRALRNPLESLEIESTTPWAVSAATAPLAIIRYIRAKVQQRKFRILTEISVSAARMPTRGNNLSQALLRNATRRRTE